jgi:hypothetical protein
LTFNNIIIKLAFLKLKSRIMAKIVHPSWVADPPPDWIIKNKDLVIRYTALSKEFEKKFVALQKEFDLKVKAMK